MKISIGSDHAGFELKEDISDTLKKMGFDVLDMGTHSADSVDYPDFAHPVADSVSLGDSDYGVLICGSGNGVAMAANKHRNIRAALCWTAELAELAVQHNNANILCLPARFISTDDAKSITRAFFDAGFEGGRHQGRVDKIDAGIKTS